MSWRSYRIQLIVSSPVHLNSDKITYHPPLQRIELLDELENIDALQRSHRMELEKILNLPDEACGIDAGTSEDLLKVVMEARREEGRHDGDDADTDTPGEPTLTRAETLRTALTIIRYIKDRRRCIFSRDRIILKLIHVPTTYFITGRRRKQYDGFNVFKKKVK